MNEKTLRSLLTKIEARDERAPALAAPMLADPAGAELLLAYLDKGGDSPAIAVELLWHHARRPTLEAWQALLDDDDPPTTAAVLGAIATLDRAAAAERMIAGVEAGDDSIVELAGLTGAAAAVPALVAKADALLATLRAKGDTLEMGPDALAMELETLPRVIVALARLGRPGYLDRLVPLARLADRGTEFAEPTRAQAARGLCAFAVPGMVPRLEGALKKEEETEVAVALIDALALIGTPRVIEFFLRRARSADIAVDRMIERLNDLIGGEPEGEVAALARRWKKAQPSPDAALGYRRGQPFELASLAPQLAGPERAPVIAADARDLTGDRLGCIRPELAAGFLDLGPRLLAWAAAHPRAPGLVLKQGAPVDVAGLG